MQAQDIPARNGWLWIKQGIALFRKAPSAWLTMSIFWSLFLGLVIFLLWPIGALMIVFFYPVLMGIWLHACREVDQTGLLKFSNIFKGFRPQIHSLLALGGLIVFTQILCSVIASKLIPLDPSVIAIVEKYPNFTPAELQAATPNLMKFTAAQALFALPVFIGTWFAPQLLVFHQMKIWHAIKWSVYACISNMGALSIYGTLCAIPLLIIGLLPAIISTPLMLVMTPIFFATVYTGYRDIFVEEIKN